MQTRSSALERALAIAREATTLARLIIVCWRDIPARVMGRGGRATAFKHALHPRFQRSLDRAGGLLKKVEA
jgi:hypothetical protein